MQEGILKIGRQYPSHPVFLVLDLINEFSISYTSFLDDDPTCGCSSSYSWMRIRPASIQIHIPKSDTPNEFHLIFLYPDQWEAQISVYIFGFWSYFWILMRPTSFPIHIPGSWSYRSFPFIFLNPDPTNEFSSSYSWIPILPASVPSPYVCLYRSTFKLRSFCHLSVTYSSHKFILYTKC